MTSRRYVRRRVSHGWEFIGRTDSSEPAGFHQLPLNHHEKPHHINIQWEVHLAQINQFNQYLMDHEWDFSWDQYLILTWDDWITFKSHQLNPMTSTEIP